MPQTPCTAPGEGDLTLEGTELSKNQAPENGGLGESESCPFPLSRWLALAFTRRRFKLPALRLQLLTMADSVAVHPHLWIHWEVGPMFSKLPSKGKIPRLLHSMMEP